MVGVVTGGMGRLRNFGKDAEEAGKASEEALTVKTFLKKGASGLFADSEKQAKTINQAMPVPIARMAGAFMAAPGLAANYANTTANGWTGN